GRRAHDRGGASEGPRRPGAPGRAARRGRVSPPPWGPLGCPNPGSFTKARTFVRAFAFVDVFMVTMGSIGGAGEFWKGCLRFDRRPQFFTLDCARTSEIERLPARRVLLRSGKHLYR